MRFVCIYEMKSETLRQAVKAFAAWEKILKKKGLSRPVKVIESYWLCGDLAMEIIDAENEEGIYHWFFPIIRFLKNLRIYPAIPWDALIHKLKPMAGNLDLPSELQDPLWTIKLEAEED